MLHTWRSVPSSISSCVALVIKPSEANSGEDFLFESLAANQRLRLLRSLTPCFVQLQIEPATPITEEIGTFQFVIDCTLKVNLRHRRDQARNVTSELVKMIVAAAASQSAAV